VALGNRQGHDEPTGRRSRATAVAHHSYFIRIRRAGHGWRRGAAETAWTPHIACALTRRGWY